MKKILISFLIVILTIPLNIVYADTSSEIKSESGQYMITLKTINTVNDGYNTFYVGQKLADYDFMCCPIVNNVSHNGDMLWEDNEYIIKSGKQTVNAVFEDYETKQKVIFPITITGIKYCKSVYGGPSDLANYTAGTGDDYSVVSDYISFFAGSKKVDGKFVIDNWDSSQVGTKEFNWTFTPADSTYETKTGTIKVKFFQKVQVATDEAITLTASKVMLTSGTKYDINIDNKDDDSTYNWTSSDASVAKVNSKGIVTPVSNGKATITCTVTDTEGNKKDLTSSVIVGSDDNYVSLSDEDIDLEVGDTLKLTMDNKVKGSTCKWTTSNKKVAKVTTASGKVTAIGKGDCYITCTVTTPDKEVSVLRCDVTVE